MSGEVFGNKVTAVAKAQAAETPFGETGYSLDGMTEVFVKSGVFSDVRDQARLALRRLELETVFRELIPSGENALLR